MFFNHGRLVRCCLSLWVLAVLAGCSGGTTTDTSTNDSETDSVVLNSSTAQGIAGAAVTDGLTELAPNQATQLSRAELQERGLDFARQNYLPMGVVMGVAELGVAGTHTATSALGGTASVEVNGSVTVVTFSSYQTSQVLLDGTVSLYFNTGDGGSDNYALAAVFESLQATQSGQTLQLDGAAALSYTHTGDDADYSLDTIWTNNSTLTDLTSSQTLRFSAYTVVTHAQLSSNDTVLDATQSANGQILYGGLRSLTGALDVSTPVVLRFSGTRDSYQVIDGQMDIASNGTVRLTVSAANTVTTSVDSGEGFEEVTTASWSSLGGATATTP